MGRPNQPLPVMRFSCLLALLLSAPALHAQTTYTWNGGAGSWEEPSNWTPAGVPTATDTAVIAAGTATLGAGTTVAGFAFTGGTLDGAGGLTVTAAMTWTGGAVRGSDTLRVAPGATLHMEGGSLSVDRAFVNAGLATWASGELNGIGRFVNEGELVLALDAATPTRFCFASPPGFVTNGPTGLIRRTGTGEATVYCGFDNAGTVRVESGSVVLRGFNATGGTDTGDYEVEAGAMLVFDGGGVRTMTAATSISGEGTVGVHGGTTTLAGPYDVRTTRFVNVNGSGVLNLDGAATTDTLEITTGTLGGGGTLTVTDALIWDGGRMQGSGTTILSEDAVLTIRGDAAKSFRDTRTLRNDGTGTWSGSGGFSNSNGTLFLNAGTLEVSAGTTDPFGSFFAGTFTNTGTLTLTSGTVTRFGSFFHNEGAVEVASGALVLSGFNANGGTDTGRYVVADSARLEFAGGNRTLTETAEVAGAGTVAFLAGSVTNAGTWKPGASPGVLTIESDYPAESGVLEVELGGLAPGTEYDQLVVTGEAALGGTLRVALTDGFTPEVGDAFTVLTATSITGTFAAVEGPAAYTLGVAYNAEDVTVTVLDDAFCAVGLQPDAHTVALYKFDEAAPGTSLDASGNGLDATDTGTEVVEGRFCSARRFDGEDDRIDIDIVREAMQGQTAWTIEYVARSENGSQIPELVNHSCQNGWWLGPRGGTSRYGIKTTTAGGNCLWTAEEFLPGLLDTEWHVYALAWDGATLSYYRDGAFRGSAPADGTFEGTGGGSNRAWIGHSDSGSGAYTAGLADDLRVSDVARSESELCTTANELGFVCVMTAAEDEPGLPSAATLHAPYPNPARGMSTLAFDLPEPQRVRLAAYDVLGREVAVLVDDQRPAGRHETVLDGRALTSGLYLIRFAAGDVVQTQRVMLLR